MTLMEWHSEHQTNVLPSCSLLLGTRLDVNIDGFRFSREHALKIKLATAAEEHLLATLIPCLFICQRPEMSFLLGSVQMDTLSPKVKGECLTTGTYEGR